jgi:putative transposase
MRSPWTGTIVEIYFDTHPHWVMDYGCYAMTLRCRGSLPLAIQEKLKEIGLSLKGIAPASPDAVALRRKHFAVLDHALDAATGSCPFAERKAAQAMSDLLADYDFDGLRFDHWVVMPNHLHLITAPLELTCAQAFRTHWSRFKALSAKHINQLQQTKGGFWQASWYDRWIRNETEHKSWQQYLQQNPIKAGLHDWNYKK